MDPQRMKDATRRFITGIFDDGNFDLLGEMTTDSYSFSIARPGVIPKETFVEAVSGFRSGFSKAASVPWVIFTRFEGDRISEQYEVWDELGLMYQLGVIPEPE